MFNKILSLVGLSLKGGLRSQIFKDKKRVSWGMMILWAFTIVYTIGSSIFYSMNISDFFIAANQAELFVGNVLLINLVTSFIQTLLMIPSQLYFSKDNNYLLPLPLEAKDILLSKFLLLWIYDFFTCIFLGLIPLLVLGYKVGVSLLFYALLFWLLSYCR